MGAENNCGKAPVSMLPQLAMGGRTPSPRKDRALSNRMMLPTDRQEQPRSPDKAEVSQWP